jgi:hypothetical protein
MARFADIANKKANEVEKPPLPPIGKYVMMVTNDPTVVARNSDKGEFEIVDFKLQGVQALDDVDLDELAKFGGAKGVMVQHSFVFNTDPEEEANFQRTEYNLTRFLVDTLKAGDDSMSLGQLMGNAKGKQLEVEVGHRPDGRPGRENDIYPDCKKVMPLD